MFLDESGDHNLKKIDKSYPIFCLAGCIVEFGYYNKVFEREVDKLKLKEHYLKPSDPYELCFQFIMERFCMFLGERRDVGIMRMESREAHNDKILAEDYETFRNQGNNMFPPEEVRRKLVDLSFNQKSQNIAGHQIADLVAYPIGSYVLRPKKENPAFAIVEKKLHRKRGTNQYLNYGLKIFP